MEYQHAATATTFSRKLSTGRGAPGKHAYDGVFGASAKVGPGVDDYREIFGGAGGCSIPILDVPELKEGKGSSVEGARSSRVDYSKIFGGFGDVDFALPYEELLMKRKKDKPSSSQEARVPTETRPHPVQSGHSNLVGEKVVSSPEASAQSFQGVKQFNLSYNKANLGSENGTNGMMKIAQLHAVPGYTHLIDEIMPSQSQMSEGGKPVRVVLNEAQVNVNVDEVKPQRRTVSGPQPRAAPENTSRGQADLQKRPSRNRSVSGDMSFDAFGFGLNEHPSRVFPLSTPPLNFVNKMNTPGRSTDEKFGFTAKDASQGEGGSYSPPFFYEEVDSNSVAAASAAALTKAIEEAQAKIKIAKEMMERKKAGLQGRVRLNVSNSLKAEKKEVKLAAKSDSFTGKETPDWCKKEGTTKQRLSEQNAINANEVFPGILENESSTAEIPLHATESMSTPVDHVEKEKEDGRVMKEFSEPAVTGELRATMKVKKGESGEKIMPSAKESETGQKVAAEENLKKPLDCVNASAEAPKQDNVEREFHLLEKAFVGTVNTDDIKSAQVLHHEDKQKDKIRVVPEFEEIDQTHIASCAKDKSENEPEMLQEPKENAIPQIKELKDMKELNPAQKRIESEDIIREVQCQLEMECVLDGSPSRGESKSKLDEIHQQKENERGQKEPWQTLEYEKEQEESWSNKEHGTDAHRGWKCQKIKNSGEVLEQVVKVNSEELLDNYEGQNGLREDDLVEGNMKLEGAKESNEIRDENCEMDETVTRQEKICEETDVLSEIQQRVEEDKNQEATFQAFGYKVENREAADDVYKEDKNENLQGNDEACVHSALHDSVEVKLEPTIGESGNVTGVGEASFEPKEVVKEMEEDERANDVKEEENFETDGLDQDLFRLAGLKKQTRDVNESFVIEKSWVHLSEAAIKFEHRQNELDLSDKHSYSSQDKHIEEVILSDDKNDKDVNESEADNNSERTEMNSVSSYNETNSASSDNEKWSGGDTEFKTPSDQEEQAEEASFEVGENNEDAMECEIATHVNDNYFESSSQESSRDKEMEMELSKVACIFEEKEETMEKLAETKQSTIKKEEKCEKTEPMSPHAPLQWEVQVDDKHRKEKEEAKEREQRMVVERAIREARERAFAEARERAERAAAEAHPRVTVQSQQRAETASEANNRSANEKAFMEAKLKAERAAVERATAEARQRALEKAISEKAASKARNLADKSSGASRNVGINTTMRNQRHKSADHSSSSRHSRSSNHGDRVGEYNCESAQRRKAVSERHQRTAERAEKALAEKNMRDLLAQKEQAERNRLAESLDAEVKRWSSGKERNLRALLSTLQYILGPDSGWQPIPLTDLISTTAVKKAYRKATLCVHPDKLQQRGASIQQKYTCEKVFDLLKEAWNKFSAEER